MGAEEGEECRSWTASVFQPVFMASTVCCGVCGTAGSAVQLYEAEGKLDALLKAFVGVPFFVIEPGKVWVRPHLYQQLTDE